MVNVRLIGRSYWKICFNRKQDAFGKRCYKICRLLVSAMPLDRRYCHICVNGKREAFR